MKRAYGTGSVYWRNGDGNRPGRWEAKFYMRLPDGTAYVRTITGKTEKQVATRLDALRLQLTQQPPLRRPVIVPDAEFAGRKHRYVAQVLEQARLHSWPDDYAAHVLLAQITRSRVLANVFGPCSYCGTWIANSVDHVVPRAAGGEDQPENLVSACKSCNSSKGATALDQWRGARIGVA